MLRSDGVGTKEWNCASKSTVRQSALHPLIINFTAKRHSSTNEQTDRPQKVLRGQAAHLTCSEKTAQLGGEAENCKQLLSPLSTNPHCAAVGFWL